MNNFYGDFFISLCDFYFATKILGNMEGKI